jgi:hypothetical protein
VPSLKVWMDDIVLLNDDEVNLSVGFYYAPM